MRTWSAQTAIGGRPHEVMDALTDPEAIRHWSPVPFQLDELEGDRLAAGHRARVSGPLGGLGCDYEIEVLEAGGDRLALQARGPVDMDVEYRVEPLDEWVHVTAQVAIAGGRGISGRLMSRAVAGLLAAGALDTALGRLARAVEMTSEAAVAA